MAVPWDVLIAYIGSFRNESYRLDRNVLRLVCKEARDEVDRNRTTLVIQGVVRHHLSDGNPSDVTSTPDMTQLLRFCQRIVQRGCRPENVELIVTEGTREERLSSTALLLQKLRPGVHRTRSLVLESDQLDPNTAAAVTGTFPSLEHITIELSLPDGDADDWAVAALGLQQLLGPGAGLNTDSAPSSLVSLSIDWVLHSNLTPIPLLDCLPKLHRLHSLQLLYCGDTCAAHLGSLNQLSQLTSLTLELSSVSDRASDLKEQLSQLGQLRDLELSAGDADIVGGTSPPPLHTIFPQLPGLTRLVFTDHNNTAVPATAFTAFSNLRELTAHGTVELPGPMGSLSAYLSSLTALTVGSLKLASKSSTSLPPDQTHCWQLPPRLKKLDLLNVCQCAAALGVLQLPTTLEEVCIHTDELELEVPCWYFAGPGGLLRPASEAVLGSALKLLARSNTLITDLTVWFLTGTGMGVQIPGLLGSGTGRVHSGWLAELGQLRLHRLRLERIRLSKSDAGVLAEQLAALQGLELHDCMMMWQEYSLRPALPQRSDMELSITYSTPESDVTDEDDSEDEEEDYGAFLGYYDDEENLSSPYDSDDPGYIIPF